MQKEINWLLKEKYNNRPDKNFEKDVKRLKAGEPLDYVIGFTEFLGCKIDLSKRPLIPRAETEFWVAQAIKNIKSGIVKNTLSRYFHDGSKIMVLDIFSGSGCIGVAVIKHIKNVKVDFVDSNKNAIKQIKINLKINNVNYKRYKIIQSNIFQNIKNKYNFIFANPPYIPEKNKNLIQKSVLKFEPKVALFGGADGLYYIRKFLSRAKRHLNSGGNIFMEFSPEQKKGIEKLLVKFGYKHWEIHKDQYNKYRWLVAFT